MRPLLVPSEACGPPVPVLPKVGGRLDSLTGLRWWAALLVFGEHIAALKLGTRVGEEERGPADEVLYFLFGTGTIGVSCFFILSGFVLAWTYRPDGDTVRRFWQRRFAKIYPVYLVSTVLAFVLFSGMGQVPGAVNVVLHLTLLQSWVPEQSLYFGLNPVTWSLSCEAFFYLMLPVLFLWLRRAGVRTLFAVVVGAVALSFVLPYTLGALVELPRPGEEMIPTGPVGGPFAYWFTYVFPGFRLLEFGAGVAAALLVRRQAWRGPSVAWSLTACLAGWLVNALLLPPRLQHEAGTFLPFVLLISSLAVADLRGGWSPLRGRRMRFLGEISYCLYVFQLLLLAVVAVTLRPALAAAGVIGDREAALPDWLVGPAALGCLMFCSLVAWAAYRWVEVPMMRRLRPQFARPGTTGRAAAAAGAETGAPAEAQQPVSARTRA
ncbi:peptidoglycan/LPS O-acetylase OafA/YrhL [Streptomyces sp. 2132.2]|uniref:acyltransferase family protein n=1 Tax=Streptomyces sp. 2132.2 TaxID=2485161 RepID=UPI000F48062C|nr:acyltransferase [Streptomyces sp. 2132.2]ROQ89052.1 peptidoglycan/LPS O-acetylase OafA/YrhL [Streptomyces sp. 2132.2]